MSTLYNKVKQRKTDTPKGIAPADSVPMRNKLIKNMKTKTKLNAKSQRNASDAIGQLSRSGSRW